MKLNIKYKASVLALSIALYSCASAEQTPADVAMTVYKNPSCGCCGAWVDHASENGFHVETIKLNNLQQLKAGLGIGQQYQSCHTGVVESEAGKYVFEGHIPAQYVEQFLKQPPEGSIGLSVPGMPVGSPGMEVGDRKDYYQVLLLKEDGTTEIYAHVNQ